MYDTMVTTSKYEKNMRSTNLWAPRQTETGHISLNNRNSVKYNILSFDDNKWAPSVQQPEKLSTTMHGRKKGIAEFNDLGRGTAVNSNVDHVRALSIDSGTFKRKDGIFTHLYNSAARKRNVWVPYGNMH